MTENEQPTYSISLRVKKVIHEYAYVSVPVTPELFVVDGNGDYKLDTDKFLEVGVELGKKEGLKWYKEVEEIMVHDIQGPPPESEMKSGEGN